MFKLLAPGFKRLKYCLVFAVLRCSLYRSSSYKNNAGVKGREKTKIVSVTRRRPLHRMADMWRWVPVREVCLHCKKLRLQMSKEINLFRSVYEGNMG